jgi:hypothetical protein
MISERTIRTDANFTRSRRAIYTPAFLCAVGAAAVASGSLRLTGHGRPRVAS